MNEPSTEETFQKAIEAHQAGRLQEAEQLYASVLSKQPQHPDANHNMGVLAVSSGKLEQALPFFEIALQITSVIDQFWISYIRTLIDLNQLGQATELMNKARTEGKQGLPFDEL